MIMVVGAGFAVDWVIDLPLPSFDALVQDVGGFRAMEEVRRAWTDMIAAQGDGASMKDHLKPLVALAQRRPGKPQPERKDGKRFAARMQEIQSKGKRKRK